MINKAWQFRVARPRIELSTCRVVGRRLIHYTNSGLLIARASQEFDLALTPNRGILRRLELDKLKLWWTRLGDRLHISLRDAYYLEIRVHWFDSFGQKSFTNKGYRTGTGMYMKSGSALSLKDRSWASFLVRYQQYIPCIKKWSDVKIGSGFGFAYVGFRCASKRVRKLVQWLAYPPPMPKVAGSSLSCALILMIFFLINLLLIT